MKNSHNCRTAMTPVTVYDLPLDIVFSVSLCLSSHFSLLNSKEKLAHKKFLSISSGQSTNPFETKISHNLNFSE